MPTRRNTKNCGRIYRRTGPCKNTVSSSVLKVQRFELGDQKPDTRNLETGLGELAPPGLRQPDGRLAQLQAGDAAPEFSFACHCLDVAVPF